MAQLSTPPQTTRIALIGAGFIAKVHLQLLARMPDVKVVAICDPNRERAEQLARQHGVGRVFSSVEELLAAAKGGKKGGKTVEVDAVHLLVPPPLHFHLASNSIAITPPTRQAISIISSPPPASAS